MANESIKSQPFLAPESTFHIMKVNEISIDFETANITDIDMPKDMLQIISWITNVPCL